MYICVCVAVRDIGFIALQCVRVAVTRVCVCDTTIVIVYACMIFCVLRACVGGGCLGAHTE